MRKAKINKIYRYHNQQITKFQEKLGATLYISIWRNAYIWVLATIFKNTVLKRILQIFILLSNSFLFGQNEQIAITEIINNRRIPTLNTFINSEILVYEKQDLKRSIAFNLLDYYYCDGNKTNKILEIKKFKFDFEDLPISYENAETEKGLVKQKLKLDKRFRKKNKKYIVTVFESIKISDSEYITRINYSEKSKNYITTNFYVLTNKTKVIDICEQTTEF